jgi:3-oxoadipate enol-lactonase
MPEVLTDDNVTLVYEDFGPRDGARVVLCHGLALSGEQLFADAEYFARRGYRVLVPDLRGHGRSGKPQTMTRDAFTIQRMAEDMVTVLDHAGVGAVHWVGNSLGGIVALDLLKRHTDRLRTLATFGSPYSLYLPRWGSGVMPLAYTVLGRDFYSWMAGHAMNTRAAGQRLTAEVVKRFDPQVGKLAGYNVASFNMIETVRNARLPILMLRGSFDVQINIWLGPALKAMRGRDNFRLVDVPWGGHCANLDAPDKIRGELLNFWQGTEAA